MNPDPDSEADKFLVCVQSHNIPLLLYYSTEDHKNVGCGGISLIVILRGSDIEFTNLRGLKKLVLCSYASSAGFISRF